MPNVSRGGGHGRHGRGAHQDHAQSQEVGGGQLSHKIASHRYSQSKETNVRQMSARKRKVPIKYRDHEVDFPHHVYDGGAGCNDKETGHTCDDKGKEPAQFEKVSSAIK